MEQSKSLILTRTYIYARHTVCAVVFACGHSSYVHKKPSGSTLCKAVSCVWVGIVSRTYFIIIMLIA